MKDIVDFLVSAKQLMQDSYSFKRERERATEAVTFLLSDTNQMNKVHGIMVSYMLSGYRLPCRIMRKIVNKVCPVFLQVPTFAALHMMVSGTT